MEAPSCEIRIGSTPGMKVTADAVEIGPDEKRRLLGGGFGPTHIFFEALFGNSGLDRRIPHPPQAVAYVMELQIDLGAALAPFPGPELMESLKERDPTLTAPLERLVAEETDYLRHGLIWANGIGAKGAERGLSERIDQLGLIQDETVGGWLQFAQEHEAPTLKDVCVRYLIFNRSVPIPEGLKLTLNRFDAFEVVLWGQPKDEQKELAARFAQLAQTTELAIGFSSLDGDVGDFSPIRYSKKALARLAVTTLRTSSGVRYHYKYPEVEGYSWYIFLRTKLRLCLLQCSHEDLECLASREEEARALIRELGLPNRLKTISD